MAAVIIADGNTIVFQRIIWKNLSKFKICPFFDPANQLLKICV